MNLVSPTLPVLSRKVSEDGDTSDQSISERVWALCGSNRSVFDLVCESLAEENRELVVEALLSARVERMFETIRDLPDSCGALEDMSRCLNWLGNPSDVWCWLASISQRQLKSRLLIPGAHTKDILKMYIRSYKAANQLIGSCRLPAARALLPSLTGPIVAQLLKRKDAVKCVASALLEGGEDDLSLPVSEKVNDSEWLPPPRGELEEETSNKSLVPLLVGVFGGRDRFLSEFRLMLAGRLLTLPGYDCERESQSVEMMKLKFGEEELVECQVMLRDVVQSKRLNSGIQNVLPNAAGLSALIVSRHFWPQNNPVSKKTNSLLPPGVDALLDAYAAAFQKARPSQTLHWRKDEGVVTVGVLLKGDPSEREYRVSPQAVAVLAQFEQGLKRSVETVSTNLSLSAEEVKRLVGAWAARGVLREVDVNTYQAADAEIN